MSIVPTLCDNCRTVFAAPIAIGGANVAMFQGCRAGPCPQCGSSGAILDGAYGAFYEVTERLLSGRMTQARLGEIISSLESLRDKKPENGPEEIQKAAPELQRLRDCLPKKRTELYAFLAILIALFIQLKDTCGGSTTDADAARDQAVTRMVERQPRLFADDNEDGLGGASE